MTILDLTRRLEEQERLLAVYKEALEMIAKNSCCHPCREAGLVASKALEAGAARGMS